MLVSLCWIACCAQIKPITGLSIEQKRELATYKIGYEYQQLDLLNYREQLENCRRINLSLTEIERLKNEQITQLKEVIILKDAQINTLQQRIEIREKPRANWLLIVLSFIIGAAGGYYIAM